MVDSDLSKRNSRLFIGGGLGVVAGGFFTTIGLISGALGLIILGTFIFLGGTGTLIYALATGLSFSMGANDKKPEERHEGAYIMNKLVVTRKGEPVYDADMHDPEEIQYLVQVEFANGRKTELKTSPEVFGSIGEGQKGMLLVQGRWINQFVFRPEAGTTVDNRAFDEPYRPGS